MSYTEVMLDLETLGTGPNALVCAIGAVSFRKGHPGIIDSFYAPIDLNTAIGDIDAKTVGWWMQQSDEARKLFDPTVAVCSQIEALGDFASWYKSHKAQALWGNGVNFDNTILRNCYTQNSQPIPWVYRHDRCFRTIKNMFPQITFERVGVHHNAVDDARTQALHLLKIYQAIKDGTG